MENHDDVAVELLKAELDVIELDDRLEMVNLGGAVTIEVAAAGNNSVCCCSS